MYFKIGVLKNFANSTGNLGLESRFNKVLGLKACNSIKKRHFNTCFPVKFEKFLRTPFFTELLQWLLVWGGVDGWGWGGVSTNDGHHDWPMTKKLKLHWLKRPKTVPKKQNLDQKIIDSKSHIWSFFVLISDFLAKVSKLTKLAKKITHFTIQFRSTTLTHFTNLKSLNIVKNILPQHSQKPYSLYKFSSKHVSGCYQKKHLYCTI